MKQIVQGLLYLHSQGVIHSDFHYTFLQTQLKHQNNQSHLDDGDSSIDQFHLLYIYNRMKKNL